MRARTRALGALGAGLASVLVLAACGSNTTNEEAAASSPSAEATAAESAPTSDAPAAAGNNKVAYVVKRMDQGWFQNEAKGAEQAGAAAGLEVSVLDSRFDASVQQSNLDTAFSQGVGGIILVIQDQKSGPQVLSQAAENGVAVIAVDDPIEDADGNPAPFVGMDTKQIGESVGTMLADAAKAQGWDPSGIGVAGLTFNEVSVCTDRTDGAKAALQAAMPELAAEQYFEANYAGANTDGGLQAMQGLITSQPNVKNWLVYSCNEEGVVGAVRALEAAGLDSGSCGVGIGDGALAKIEFEKGSPAYCGSLFANSVKHGETAANLMADYLLNGKPIPPVTLVPGEEVTPENWSTVFGG